MLICPDLEKKLISQKEIISIAIHQVEIRSFIYVPESCKIPQNNGNNRHLDSFGLSAYMNTNEVAMKTKEETVSDLNEIHYALMCFSIQTLRRSIFCKKKWKTAQLDFRNVPHHFNDCPEKLPCVCKSGVDVLMVWMWLPKTVQKTKTVF